MSWKTKKSKKNIHYHTAECPKCGKKTKLIWVPDKRTLPRCDKCYKKLDPKTASRFKVHYLPIIILFQVRGWVKKPGLSRNFTAIHQYIIYCLSPEKCPKELKKYLTKDIDTLSGLMTRLKNCKGSKKKYKGHIEILTKRLEEYKESKTKTKTKLPWKILPPGIHPFDRIKSHYEKLQDKTTSKTYDLERLQAIYGLEPTDTYIGLEEFEGYIVFYFQEKDLAILECPVVGNAIYILNENWKNLSKLSKSELLKSHRANTKRIIHRGKWLQRLSYILNK